MRARATFLLLGIAGLAASGAMAAATANSKDLLLRSSDVPAGAKRVSFGGTTGAIKIPRTVHGQAAYVAYTFTNRSRRETVGNAVGKLGSTRDAHDVYLDLKGKAKNEAGFHRLSLPGYGNEQFAFGTATRAVSLGVVVARSGSVLWEVIVSDLPGFSEAQLTGELDKYARKAKKRAAG